MLLKRMQQEGFPFEKAIPRITQEIALFDSIYYRPKIEGAVNVFVPNTVKGILQDRLTYLQSHAQNQTAIPLMQKLTDMGVVMGYDARGIFLQDNPYSDGVDLAHALPSKGYEPFFVWGAGDFLRHDIEFLNDINESSWLERSTGPIDDCRGNLVLEGHGITMYTKKDKALQTHGLSIHKKYLDDSYKGVDTRLSFDCGFHSMEGFMYSISFNLKGGKLLAVVDGNRENSIGSALNRIWKELRVRPQHLLYYIQHSNLDDQHRKDIADVIDALVSYPAIDTFDLFDAQKPRNFHKLRQLLTRVAPKIGAAVRDATYVDLSQLTEHYKYVTAQNLDVEELRAIGIPNERLTSACVAFDTQAGLSYRLHYNIDHPTGPYLLLRSENHMNEDDFRGVQESLLLSHSHDPERISNRGNDLCNTMKLNDPPSIESIANDIEQSWSRVFTNVSVESLFFTDVPLREVENNSLKEKLHCQDPILK